MMSRVQELCRKLEPVLGKKVNGLWHAYLSESDASGKADIEQTLELLAAKHLGQSFQPDRSPFPPPGRLFAQSGDVGVGSVLYGGRELHPFRLRSTRLKEHLLVCGRSGSGKTNLTFVLVQGIMNRGIKVLALDWKRGYRDLLSVRSDVLAFTIGREVSPFRFNPLIPPLGCEPQVWIKLIVDVIASAYLGGEGVISLLVAGLDHLYREAGVFDQLQTRWPTVQDLLVWLKTVKLRGRAAMWQASAERILLAMTYGEFGAVINTQDNSHVRELLHNNVVLEMDGLSSNSDRKMFSEALTLYLYRLRLAQGPQEKLTNVIVIEEAHNLLLRKATEAKESMLESSIRMIRQYGMGYVFVDQSASLLSKVAFANSYATIALSQKLKSDVQAISGAMNLTDEQQDALSTLAVGTAVVRLADEHPEPFLVKIPRFPIREGCVSDEAIRARMAGCFGKSASHTSTQSNQPAITELPSPDETNKQKENPHPPPPGELIMKEHTNEKAKTPPAKVPQPKLTREEIRFLADVASRPLSTTVARYQRLNFSRRRGNAIRQHLLAGKLIEAVPIATRSGQVVLYQLSEPGRALCGAAGIDCGSRLRTSLEHMYWVNKTVEHFEQKGYEVTREHQIKGSGAADLLLERPGERVVVEVETGKSDVKKNVTKLAHAGFDKIVLIATGPEGVTACSRAVEALGEKSSTDIEQLTWLDIS